MKNRTKNSTVKWILFTGLIGILISGTGCINEPNHKIEYGPQVSVNKIRAAWLAAKGSKDSPGNIQNEEFVSMRRTQLLRGIGIKNCSISAITVVDRKDSINQWQVNAAEEYLEYEYCNSENKKPILYREAHDCWNKESGDLAECEIDTLSQKAELGINFELAIHLKPRSEDLNEGIDRIISYHNLKVNTHLEDPPYSVNARCPDSTNCQINVTEIDFDLVDWTFDPEGKKYHYHWKVSPEVPQLARVLDDCQQVSVALPQPGQDPKKALRVLVTECLTVVDYQLPPPIPTASNKVEH
jgi:hypothetical protein